MSAGTGIGEEIEYVTVSVADQLFGLPIARVREVFVANALTAIPLAPREIVGLINLRGRVITAICLRRRLGLPDRQEGPPEMAVGIEHHGESYGLRVDAVGEVMKLSAHAREPNPAHMDPRWLEITQGVHRIERRLLIVLDVDALLSFDVETRAA